MSIGLTNLDGALQVNVRVFLGRRLILIRESSIEIQTWFLACLVNRARFDMDRVQELRFEEWREAGIWTCGIRFKYEGATHVLVRAANDSEKLRTVLKIIKVYRFSHSPPLKDQPLTHTA
jgi:hypothetical protein